MKTKETRSFVIAVAMAFLLLLGAFPLMGQTNEQAEFKAMVVEKVAVEDFEVPDSLYTDEDGAIYLHKIGISKSEFSSRGVPQLTLNVRSRILILNDKGLELADKAISLYVGEKDSQTISGVKGRVYNLKDGNIDVYKLKSTDWQIDRYDDERKLVRLSFRNVKQGSIIDLEYTIHDPYVFRMDDWYFQLDQPVIYSEYRVSYPSNFSYKILKLGIHPLDQSKSFYKRVRIGGGGLASLEYDEMNYLFSAKNVPSLKREPHMDSPENYRAMILTEIHFFDPYDGGEREFFYKNWFDSVNNYAESGKNERFYEFQGMGVYFDVDGEGLSEEEIISDVYNQVRSAVRTNGERGSIVMDRKPLDIISSGSASDSEINMLLMSALRKNKIEAYPFLYSRRTSKRVLSEFPIFSQFNALMVLAYIGDSYLLLDASDMTLTPGEISENSYNGEGLVAQPDKPRWYPLASKMPSVQRCTIELTELAESNIKGELRVTLSGVYADRVRHFLEHSNQDELGDYFSLSDGVELNYVDGNINEYADNVEMSFQVLIALEKFNDSFVFPAITIEPIVNNPFDNEIRRYPIVYPDYWEEHYTCLLKLDAEKYDVEVPESKKLILPDKSAELIFSSAYNYGSLIVRSSVRINKDRFDQSEYPSLRTFYDQVSLAQSSFIEIKQK